jgi:phage repressor protein C with HTH and peptisase S24 domain
VETTGWPIDIPVVRVELAAGGDGFLLENTVIDRLPRPPGIRSAVNIYAFYVVDDSMSPRFEPGDPVYVSPDRPPVPGCDILIELQTDDGAPRSMIRRLISRKRTGLTLRRFNPDTTDLVPLDRIRRVHRILSLRELAGA